MQTQNVCKYLKVLVMFLAHRPHSDKTLQALSSGYMYTARYTYTCTVALCT